MNQDNTLATKINEFLRMYNIEGSKRENQLEFQDKELYDYFSNCLDEISENTVRKLRSYFTSEGELLSENKDELKKFMEQFQYTNSNLGKLAKQIKAEL